jgi:GrpB-like predicted nucleotidyltransferase (UPF0157 family)
MTRPGQSSSRAEATKLTELLGPWSATPDEHIGSTSMRSLAAKPILDMMAGVHDLRQVIYAAPFRRVP